MVPTVPVYVVLADASKEHADQRLGMFFRVIDAEAFMATLTQWTNPRIVAEQVPAGDIHPAHSAVPSVAKALKSVGKLS